MADRYEKRARSNREALLSLLTGAVAQPASGFAGLYGLITGGAAKGAHNVEATQQALTYQPRDPSSLQALGRAVEPVTGRLQQLRSYLGDTVMTHTGSPGAATAAYMVPDTLLSLLGARGMGAKGPSLAQIAERSVREPGMAQAGMIAYHGTPHRFAPTPDNELGAFDMSKLGTGEGAQAYGHGLYLAGDKAVGQMYQKALAPLTQADPWWKSGVRQRLAAGDSLGDAVKRVAGNDGALTQKMNGLNESDFSAPSGNLYRVDVPDEHVAKMLDWDKPLSEQPHAQAAADKIIASGALDKDAMREWTSRQHKTASEFYTILQQSDRVAGQSGATDLLRQHGIPGIKYLDGGSRGAGQGSHNYVVFDDQLPKIIGRE